MSCSKEVNCAFTNCDSRYKLLSGISLYEDKFCKGQEKSCIRYRLDEKYGPVQVPTNMMPNGLPLPGTHRRDWTLVALEHKKYLDNREY